MERTVAVKKLSKMLGKRFGYRVDAKALTGEERETAQAKLRDVVAARKEAEEKRRARMEAVLAADEEYQHARTAEKLLIERVRELQAQAFPRKITVGVSNSMFFHVKAQGDSWEEIIEKITAEKRAA